MNRDPSASLGMTILSFFVMPSEVEASLASVDSLRVFHFLAHQASMFSSLFGSHSGKLGILLDVAAFGVGRGRLEPRRPRRGGWSPVDPGGEDQVCRVFDTDGVRLCTAADGRVGVRGGNPAGR